MLSQSWSSSYYLYQLLYYHLIPLCLYLIKLLPFTPSHLTEDSNSKNQKNTVNIYTNLHAFSSPWRLNIHGKLLTGYPVDCPERPKYSDGPDGRDIHVLHRQAVFQAPAEEESCVISSQNTVCSVYNALHVSLCSTPLRHAVMKCLALIF